MVTSKLRRLVFQDAAPRLATPLAGFRSETAAVVRTSVAIADGVTVASLAILLQTERPVGSLFVWSVVTDLDPVAVVGCAPI